jgi:hypothetical protein
MVTVAPMGANIYNSNSSSNGGKFKVALTGGESASTKASNRRRNEVLEQRQGENIIIET